MYNHYIHTYRCMHVYVVVRVNVYGTVVCDCVRVHVYVLSVCLCVNARVFVCVVCV